MAGVKAWLAPWLALQDFTQGIIDTRAAFLEFIVTDGFQQLQNLLGADAVLLAKLLQELLIFGG